jgi:hypothetical protein
MPIHVCDIPVRGGTQPLYVWNFYNHIIAFAKEPIRCLTDKYAFLAMLAYSIPSLIHISISVGAGYLLSKLLHRYSRRDRTNVTLGKM